MELMGGWWQIGWDRDGAGATCGAVVCVRTCLAASPPLLGQGDAAAHRVHAQVWLCVQAGLLGEAACALREADRGAGAAGCSTTDEVAVQLHLWDLWCALVPLSPYRP